MDWGVAFVVVEAQMVGVVVVLVATEVMVVVREVMLGVVDRMAAALAASRVVSRVVV